MIKKVLGAGLVGILVTIGVLGASTPDLSVSSSIAILPKRGAVPATLWGTNVVYANGMYVKNGFRFYMCLVPGTSGATTVFAPTHTTGCGTNKGDGLRWFVVERTPRKTWTVQNIQGGTVRVTTGQPETNNVGFAIGAPLGSIGEGPGDVFQDEIYVTTTGSTVNALEW